MPPPWRELWLHMALERQVARGMAWIGAWGRPVPINRAKVTGVQPLGRRPGRKILVHRHA